MLQVRLEVELPDQSAPKLFQVVGTQIEGAAANLTHHVMVLALGVG